MQKKNIKCVPFHKEHECWHLISWFSVIFYVYCTTRNKKMLMLAEFHVRQTEKKVIKRHRGDKERKADKGREREGESDGDRERKR
jgi:hypothetical protein